MTETWVPAPDWPLYEVSSSGRVRRSSPGRGTRAGKVLKRQPGTNGYWHVYLSDGEGNQASVAINILVCRAFHGEIPAPGMHAAHDNGDKDDNSAGNLYWATPTRNASDRVRHGTHNKGVRNPRSRLSEAKVIAIRVMAQNHTQREVARTFLISEASVSVIVNRKQWSHIP